RLRRRSLAALRQQVEAVDPASFAAFLPAWQSVATLAKKRPIDELVRQLAGAPLIASTLDDPLLASRSRDASMDLDAALTSGEVVWIGLEALGTRDGRVALLPRELAPALMPPEREDPPSEALHTAIVSHLKSFGASFFTDVYHGVGGGSTDDVVEAMWDLVWAGVVTNDSLAPLRGFTARRRRKAQRRPNVVAVPNHARGRWYLTESLRAGAGSPEERALNLAHALLDRYGVVTRDVVLAEGIVGGFSGLYPAFSSLEDIGTVRRGYFIEGMGGAQFALPGAVERLRHLEPSPLTILAATDPAQAYGASVPWPHADNKVERRAGARVALADGVPVAWLDPAGRRVVTFDADEATTVGAIEELSFVHGKVSIATIDGSPAPDHDLAPALLAAGFLSGYKGFTVRPVPAGRRG
ncbi:MAG: Lhr family helicase, partial [Acidimicrobiia bacterium]